MKVANTITKSVLDIVGFENTSPEDFFPKNVELRDGREAIIWIHRKTGHGILDSQYWESQDFYSEEYRKEFSAEVGKKVTPEEHLQIYNDLNQRQINSFSRFLTEKTRFLEIGCSFGGILNKVVSAVDICHGVEPNKEDVEFVRLNNKKVKVYNTTFEQADLAEDFYDTIVSIEVLEHTLSPRNFLNKCFSLLKTDGILHVEVPNHNDVLLTCYEGTGYNRFFYHKAHIHYFTKDSLQILCNQCGFNGDTFSFLMYPFFNHVWWVQNHKAQSSAAIALSTPIPTPGKTKTQQAINEFYQKTELEYEQLINKNIAGDCLIFQGHKLQNPPLSRQS